MERTYVRSSSADDDRPPKEDLNADAATRLLGDLNEEQRLAASFSGGPLLIIAGAGTGKTTTLAHRVAHLIASGIDPGHILLLTFTRRAADEMMRRVEGLLHGSAGQGGRRLSGTRVWGGTFHAVGARLLRMHAHDVGLEPDFTILDRGDAEDLMHACRTELGLGSSGSRFPQKSTCLDIYSRCVDSQTPLADICRRFFPWCTKNVDGLSRLFETYTQAKERQRVLDYDDLLLFWHAALSEPDVGERVRERFDHVLVDEYQDTNTVQADIVSLLRPGGDGLTVVGDDAQAIYSFRAATVRNILDFDQRFPAATLLTLTRNYRSTAPILSATNALIAEAAERHEKDLWTARDGGGRPYIVQCRDEAEQTDWLIERILDHREQGSLLKRQAVLFRAQHHSMHLEMELQRRNIPFVKYGGLKFIEMAHVKDLLAFLRLAENPRDVTAGLRALGMLPGIGPKTASALLERLAASGWDFDAWAGVSIPEPVRDQWQDFVQCLGFLSNADGDASSVPAQVHAVRSILSPLIERRYDNVASRLRDLEQIEALAGRFASRRAMLSDMTLDPPSYAQELAGPPLLDEDFLILSTMHSAKGLEWDVVFVIHASDGNIPSDMSTGSPEEIEEERRLFYVACTRARDHLYVTHPVRYYTQPWAHSDTHGIAQRTRFLTDPVVARFVTETARPQAEPSDGQSTSGGTWAGIRARQRIRGLWS